MPARDDRDSWSPRRLRMPRALVAALVGSSASLGVAFASCSGSGNDPSRASTPTVDGGVEPDTLIDAASSDGTPPRPDAGIDPPPPDAGLPPPDAAPPPPDAPPDARVDAAVPPDAPIM